MEIVKGTVLPSSILFQIPLLKVAAEKCYENDRSRGSHEIIDRDYEANVLFADALAH